MIKAKFTDLYRRTLYFIFSLSWVSGTVFFVLSRFCMIEGDFGPQRHPWQFPMLSIHGASAFLMIFYFGFIMASHVPITWKLKKIRTIGIILVSAIVFQVLTAYLLYYMSDESYREWVANLHAIVGFTLPLILTTHILHALRLRRKQTASEAKRS
jgi:cytochrome b561